MDITAAFLHARSFKPKLFVRSLMEEQDQSKLWHLTVAACGIADSGRLRYLTSDSALTIRFGLSRSKNESMLKNRWSPERSLIFLLLR